MARDTEERLFSSSGFGHVLEKGGRNRRCHCLIQCLGALGWLDGHFWTLWLGTADWSLHGNLWVLKGDLCVRIFSFAFILFHVFILNSNSLCSFLKHI